MRASNKARSYNYCSLYLIRGDHLRLSDARSTIGPLSQTWYFSKIVSLEGGSHIDINPNLRVACSDFAFLSSVYLDVGYVEFVWHNTLRIALDNAKTHLHVATWQGEVPFFLHQNQIRISSGVVAT